MGKKRSKKFIENKEATKFRLLHRSQKDPLIADDQHGQHVLHPIETDKEAEERRKYGIYYKDDYDYLRHLKQVGEVIEVEGAEPVECEVILADNPRNRLPSCIFETKGVELKVGLLNQAASSNELLPNIDPDVAAALDGNVEPISGLEDEVEELEDDFVQMANGGDGAVVDGAEGNVSEMRDEEAGRQEMMRRFGLIRRSKDKFSDESSADDDEEDTDAAVDGEANEDAESLGTTTAERKSKFTNYSMSSAVVKRSDGLRHIDDHFESLYESQYGEEQEGEVDEDEAVANKSRIDPNNSERFRALLEEEEAGLQRRFPRELPDEELKEAVLRYAEAKEGQEEEDQEETEHILIPQSGAAKRGRWDCESILSTYSTLYNHPTEIREPSGNNKRKINSGLTKSGLNNLEKMEVDQQKEFAPSIRSSRVSTASTFRPKGETPEERRLRKQAIKEERRERRHEKKANKVAFQEQKLVMDAQKLAPNSRQKIRPIH